ncbi:3'(2'),5'-bisphosphate nucleotidase CysQ [Sphingomonas abietis]|uniref:3'(2'),5'-bisphosphate nucleotidase CysQ n=1 Tax=Sphingomonas abietis TaxID=3012344 RepID=A0ABY7NM56_9SPHN|nr:3'(2'),5'-bisphosphate nucleotidase CysQ [Sphingomonas abietis]WBO22055.1 3'(2'),5'-bisphosphate nucleotidase CysQ [Sphingomonas abietis]
MLSGAAATIFPAVNDIDLAAALADFAGRLLLDLRRSELLSGKALGEAGDQTANAFLVRAIRHQRPDDGLLSEESVDDRARLDKSRVWIVDPLDGTREYAEGREDWAVHVALAIDGVPVVGAVAEPARATLWRSDTVRLAALHGEPGVMVSRSRPPDVATRTCAQLALAMKPMGSAGAKTMALLRGDALGYIHAGGQYEWDSAAPVAIALAAGLNATRLDGQPLLYNQPDPYMPDLLISRPEWTERLRGALARCGGQAAES